jgi:hypothetical protein
MSGGVGSNYALGANIDAVTTAGWNAAANSGLKRVSTGIDPSKVNPYRTTA